jgi:energy-coupling factor transport system substrate-specific component
LKYRAKELLIMALTASLMFVVGYFLFVIGSFLGIASSKFLMFAPFFSFMLTIIVNHLRKLWTVSLISFVLAFIMSFISIFMGAAILVSGIFTDILALLLFRGYNSDKKILFSIPFYSLFSFLTSFVIVNYITGNKVYILATNPTILTVTSIVIYILGFIGSNVAMKVIVPRIWQAKKIHS